MDDLEFFANEWRYDQGGWQYLVAVYWSRQHQKYVEIPLN